MQTPTPPQVIEAKDLPTVSGPMVPEGPDLAGGAGDGIRMALRRSSRKVSIPSVALPPGPLEVRDSMSAIPGWKAYRIEVPPHAKVKARLKGLHEAWFRVLALNKWGEIEAGMLQNKIPTGNPEASFINPKAERHTVYFVVDSTDLGVEGETYSLFVSYP
jgi:hypothetical protein